MNKKRFATKIDWFGLTILLVPAIAVSIFTIISIIDTAPSSSKITMNIMIVISILFWGFVLLSLFATYYELDERKIKARMAFFRVKEAEFREIEDVSTQEFGKSIIGLSKDVISIKLKNGNILNISPRKTEEFLAEIEDRIS
ncbi:MAG: PH domain-containing protein [Candidatus Kapaibacterium sp.]|nr:PH domain-containing protein [Ignavibacteriota bacterium]MCB9221204.1 PH domain-containing protein [Ignavibacteria bacterium]